MKRGTWLMHYASEYYDPVKAHEYYEEHKKLKGRKTTSGLNEEGRIAAQYTKQQLNEEKKQKIEASKNERDSTIEGSRSSTESQIEANNASLESQVNAQQKSKEVSVEVHKKMMETKISSLSARLKSMTPEQKLKMKDQIKGEIDGLKKSNAEQRARLIANYQNAVASLRAKNKEANTSLRAEHQETSKAARDTHSANVKAINDEYSSKYEQELDKIKSDASMQKQKKAKSSRSSTKIRL